MARFLQLLTALAVTFVAASCGSVAPLPPQALPSSAAPTPTTGLLPSWLQSPADFRERDCRQAKADEEAFLAGNRLLEAAARTDDSATLNAANRINAAAQNARTYVLAACRGVMSPDQSSVCAAAMDWVLYFSHGKHELEAAVQRLRPVVQIYKVDLEKAFESVADAISTFGQFLYFEYNCLAK